MKIIIKGRKIAIIQITIDPLLGTMKARRQWNDTFKKTKGKKKVNPDLFIQRKYTQIFFNFQNVKYIYMNKLRKFFAF